MHHQPMFSLPPLSAPSAHTRVTVMTEDVIAAIADHVGGAGVTNKSAIVRDLRLPRSTVSSHVDWLLNRGILTSAKPLGSLGRGRPADFVSLNPAAAVVIAVEMGARYTTTAVLDLAGNVLGRRRFPLQALVPPEEGLELISSAVDELEVAIMANKTAHKSTARVAAVALPARLDSGSGTPLRPMIMPTWDGFQVRDYLEERWQCPVVLENDCGVRAYGEAAFLGSEELPLVSVQIGTGIGSGVIDSAGEIMHGTSGAAGEIGHIATSRSAGELCSCDAYGCVETVASIPSMLRRLEPTGALSAFENVDADALVQLVRDRNPDALRVVKDGAEAVGEVVSALCDILNPKRVVITGCLTTVTHEVLASVRGVVYNRARPLATKDLIIDYSRLGDNTGIAGAYLLARRHLLSASRISRIRVPSK